MQGRSWMAALTLAAGLIAAPALADNEPGAAAPQAQPPSHGVRLELRIAGLGPQGCDVEVKPGHPVCRFRTVAKHISSQGRATLELSDVQTQSADRDCTFAITIREPGQPERTVRRGLRLAATPAPGQFLTLACYLNSPSKVARAGEAANPKR